MTTSSDLPLLHPPFVTFLRHAVIAARSQQAEARALWLQAATHLHATDEDSIAEYVDILINRSALTEALEVAECAAELYPQGAAANFCLGYALQMAGRHVDALAPYHRAMECNADYPQLRSNLAVAIRLSGGVRKEELMLLERAIQVHPLDCNAWINLVIARRDAFDLAGALEAGRRAVELAPQNPRAHNNYALALKEAQRWEEAEAHSLSACRLAPDDASYRHNLSILHLVRGNYSDGWIAHESRWSGSSELRGALPLLSAPQWQGEPLAGKTLLVWGEQGMGDVLQFCRLIPLIAEKVHLEGGRIKWNTFPQLGTLLERSLGEHVDGFSVGGGIESLPSFDYHLPLISAARVLGVLETAIPAPSPYLHADPCRTALWRTRFAEERRLKVGLAWTGSPHHQRNPFRRVGWERYAECLKEIDGVAFYSLQMGANIEVEAARAVGFQIEDHSAQFATFDESAAFIGALDLVITVCTSVAHLSGALGRPTWVLLDANPHWPWLLHRSDSPWYPSVRLYRQKKFGQWEHVMRKLGNDLRQYVCRGGRANSDRRVSGMPGA